MLGPLDELVLNLDINSIKVSGVNLFTLREVTHNCYVGPCMNIFSNPYLSVIGETYFSKSSFIILGYTKYKMS
jgi:hypothetical protein